MSIINWVTSHYQDISAIFGQIVALASAIVLITPTTKDDAFLGKVISMIEKLSIFTKK